MGLNVRMHESLARIDESECLFDNGKDSPFEVIDYLHGRCHLFALAVCRAIGEDAKFNILHDNEGFDGEGQLLHAYVEVGDIMFDARGQIELEDFAEYEADSSMDIDYFQMSESEVLKKLSDKHWGEDIEGELQVISAFFKKHKSIYLDGNIVS